MPGRILMTTAAALALAGSVAAQDQGQPLETEQKLNQEIESAQDPLQEQSATDAMTDRPQGEGGQPPAMAGEQPPEPTGEGMAAEEEPAPPADMAFLEVQEEAQFLADEEVIGKNVRNINDEEVGTIADLVMDEEQKLVGVVLSVGGFLGIGEKWVAIPVDQIEFPSRDQPARLLVAVTEEQLKNAPDFTTRATVEAEQEAAQAQQQATDQQQQIPPPTQ